jgi:2-polyprenyl-6-methoxyphenol hydroxylase-like FAD-dependent oxidoreductase
MEKNSAIIVGGGIGGLTAAIALGKKGYPSIVLEQAEAFAPVGAGIQLGPNAFHMFERLGIAQLVQEKCSYPEAGLMRDMYSAEIVGDLPMGDAMIKRYGNPYAVVHRGHLHNVLVDACIRLGNIELKTNSKLISYEDKTNHVIANLENGASLSGCVLIGADGVWSGVRKQMIGADSVPQNLGYFAYRAVCNSDDIPEDLFENTVTLWAGPGFHIMHYPLEGGKLFNLVAVFRSARFARGESDYGGPDELQEIFASAHPKARRLLEFIDTSKNWNISVLEPIKDWSCGRVMLIGDAAHPMLQAMAQGACQAIEDGVCLADFVEKNHGDYQKAFLATQNARQMRATQMQYQSRKYWEIYHAAGVYSELRKKMLIRGAAEAIESVAWAYDPVTWE